RERGEDERDRAGYQELVPEGGEGLRVVLAGSADDEHQPESVALDGRREQARRIVQPRDGRPVCVDRPAPGGSQLGGAQQRRRLERPRGVEHATTTVQQLGEALPRLDQPPAALARKGAGLAYEGPEIVRADRERGVECGPEVGLDRR